MKYADGFAALLSQTDLFLPRTPPWYLNMNIPTYPSPPISFTVEVPSTQTEVHTLLVKPGTFPARLATPSDLAKAGYVPAEEVEILREALRKKEVEIALLREELLRANAVSAPTARETALTREVGRLLDELAASQIVGEDQPEAKRLLEQVTGQMRQISNLRIALDEEKGREGPCREALTEIFIELGRTVSSQPIGNSLARDLYKLAKEALNA